MTLNPKILAVAQAMRPDDKLTTKEIAELSETTWQTIAKVLSLYSEEYGLNKVSKGVYELKNAVEMPLKDRVQLQIRKTEPKPSKLQMVPASQGRAAHILLPGAKTRLFKADLERADRMRSLSDFERILSSLFPEDIRRQALKSYPNLKTFLQEALQAMGIAKSTKTEAPQVTVTPYRVASLASEFLPNLEPAELLKALETAIKTHRKEAVEILKQRLKINGRDSQNYILLRKSASA